MKFQQIRNATVKIEYKDVTFLVDPWLIEKGGMGSLGQTPFSEYTYTDYARDTAMPLVDLPYSKEDIVENVDAYIITHVHPDHIDMYADGTIGDKALNRNIPTFVQSAEDKKTLEANGFTNVFCLNPSGEEFKGVKISAAEAIHGTLQGCGPAAGYCLEADNEPTLYATGDTVWYDGVQRNLDTFKPEVIIVNGCAAELKTFGRLIMGDQDIIRLHEAAPNAKIIISHMEAVAHATINRAEMAHSLEREGILESVLIPADGESYTIS